MRKSMIITQCGECKDRSLSLTSWMFEEGQGRLPGGGDVKDPISEAEHHAGTEECGERWGGGIGERLGQHSGLLLMTVL